MMGAFAHLSGESGAFHRIDIKLTKDNMPCGGNLGGGDTYGLRGRIFRTAVFWRIRYGSRRFDYPDARLCSNLPKTS